MSSGDHAYLMNAKIHTIFGCQASRKLIDKVLPFVHGDDFLAFWVHMNCEPKPTRGIGY